MTRTLLIAAGAAGLLATAAILVLRDGQTQEVTLGQMSNSESGDDAVTNLTAAEPFLIPRRRSILVTPSVDALVCVQRFLPGGVPFCDPRWVPMVHANTEVELFCGKPWLEPRLPDGGPYPEWLRQSCVVACVPIDAGSKVTCVVKLDGGAT